MHQCFGAMDARVDALDARVIRAQDHCMTQMMRAMEETTRTVQRRVVRRRGDNGNVVAQPQAIEQRCHAPGGCDVRGGVESREWAVWLMWGHPPHKFVGLLDLAHNTGCTFVIGRCKTFGTSSNGG